MHRIHIPLIDLLNRTMFLLLFLSLLWNDSGPCTVNVLYSFRNGFSFYLKVGNPSLQYAFIVSLLVFPWYVFMTQKSAGEAMQRNQAEPGPQHPGDAALKGL